MSGSLNFFATFAPLREIFRVLVAASPRWGLCVKYKLGGAHHGAGVGAQPCYCLTYEKDPIKKARIA